MKKIILSVLAASFFLSTASCGVIGNNTGNTETEAPTYFEMDAFTNNSASEAYDSEYFYRNEFRQYATDTSSIYVPEGRHADENGVDLYGGYYYMFPSGTNMGNHGMFTQRYDTYSAANPVLRSKDLVEWELCGALNDGFSTRIDHDKDWIAGFTWAPGVHYDEEHKKYVIYYAATSKVSDGGLTPSGYQQEYSSSTLNSYDRFYVAIAVSDTPVGPFETVSSENYYGDAQQPNLNGKIITNENPPINFKYDLGLDEHWSNIDPQPFVDSKGDLYLYVCRHVCSDYNGVDIWGIKMKDAITPDYDTMTYLIKGDYETVTKNDRWNTSTKAKYEVESYDIGARMEGSQPGELFYHGNGNEGAFGYEANGRNYLIFNGGGYENHYYDACQTISDTGPLGPFKKLPKDPGSIVGTTVVNDWATGSGHGSLIHSSDSSQLFWIGNCMGNKAASSTTSGRYYYLTEVFLVEDKTYGQILYGNGPTHSLQPRIKDDSGWKNIANEAVVSATNAIDKGSKKYINDKLFVSQEYFANEEMGGIWEYRAEGSTEITLTFDDPREIGAVMVYNSYNYEYAFATVDYIELELAEKPGWYMDNLYLPTARISNLRFNKEDYVGDGNIMRTGASVLASFNPVKVKSVKISISKKLGEAGKEIRISDVVVLGK